MNKERLKKPWLIINVIILVICSGYFLLIIIGLTNYDMPLIVYWIFCIIAIITMLSWVFYYEIYKEFFKEVLIDDDLEVDKYDNYKNEIKEQERQKYLKEKRERFNKIVSIYGGYRYAKDNGNLTISLETKTKPHGQEIKRIIRNFLLQNKDLKYLEYFVCPSKSINNYEFEPLYYDSEFTKKQNEDYNELYKLIKPLCNYYNFSDKDFSLANRAIELGCWSKNEFIEELENYDGLTKTEVISIYFTGEEDSEYSYENLFEFFEEAQRLNYLYEAVSEEFYVGNKSSFYLLVFDEANELKRESYNKLLNEYGLKTKIEKLNDYEIYKHIYNRGLSKEKIIEFDALYNDIGEIPYYYLKEQATKSVNNFYKELKKKEYIKNLLNEDRNFKKTTLADIDLMSGYDFEKFIVELFRKMGYKAYSTKLSGDQGADVIAENGDVKIAIQTKCYSGSVGNGAIQEIVAGMKYYDADKAMVITNSTFTKSAIELAKKNNVQLWDRKTLKEKLEEIL